MPCKLCCRLYDQVLRIVYLPFVVVTSSINEARYTMDHRVVKYRDATRNYKPTAPQSSPAVFAQLMVQAEEDVVVPGFPEQKHLVQNDIFSGGGGGLDHRVVVVLLILTLDRSAKL